MAISTDQLIDIQGVLIWCFVICGFGAFLCLTASLIIRKVLHSRERKEDQPK